MTGCCLEKLRHLGLKRKKDLLVTAWSVPGPALVQPSYIMGAWAAERGQRESLHKDEKLTGTVGEKGSLVPPGFMRENAKRKGVKPWRPKPGRPGRWLGPVQN